MHSDSSSAPKTDICFLSVVLPCYNGEPYLSRTLRCLTEFLAGCAAVPTFELIVVDDGSTDQTAEIVAREFPDASFIRHQTNRGKGAAVRSGMEAAGGRFRAFIDADLPYDLAALPTMLRYVDFKEFDLCIGHRGRPGSAKAVERGWMREIASRVFTAFVSRWVVTGVRDTQCGFKVFRGEIADYLFAQGRIDNFAFDVEILYLAFKNDFDVKRLPVTLVSDENSTVALFRHGIPMLIRILGIPYRWYSGGYALFTD